MTQNKQATQTLPPNSVKQGSLLKHWHGNAILYAALPANNVAREPLPAKIAGKTDNTKFQDYPDVLDVKQVSKLLNVSSKTVYRLINDGKLASLKVGRAFKIPKIHLLQYIKVLEYTQSKN